MRKYFQEMSYKFKTNLSVLYKINCRFPDQVQFDLSFKSVNMLYTISEECSLDVMPRDIRYKVGGI